MYGWMDGWMVVQVAAPVLARCVRFIATSRRCRTTSVDACDAAACRHCSLPAYCHSTTRQTAPHTPQVTPSPLSLCHSSTTVHLPVCIPTTVRTESIRQKAIRIIYNPTIGVPYCMPYADLESLTQCTQANNSNNYHL